MTGVQTHPDVYFIILDGYARADVLEEVFDFDNGEFLQALERQGFYIANSSHSNYNKTLLWIASAINYAYLPDLLGHEPVEGDNTHIQDLLIRSRARTQLEALGYETVAFRSSYLRTEWKTQHTTSRSPRSGTLWKARACPSS